MFKLIDPLLSPSDKIEHLVELLGVLHEMNPIPYSLISEIQKAIWDDRFSGFSEQVDEYLDDFAYDLDFYEPDNTQRKAEPAFYGQFELQQCIEAAIRDLSQFLLSDGS